MSETVSTSLTERLLRDIRAEQVAQRTLLLQAIDYMRKMEQRLDARIVATRDDLELMLKSELLGRLGNFEVKVENLIAELKDDLRDKPE